MRIVFLGTPDYAVPVLSSLFDAGYEVAAVVTQPDRPAGRGRALTSPPVAVWARERGIPVLQPPSLRPPEVAGQLAALAPDAMAVASYGRILPPAVLALPAFGCLNVHPSLLPRHRGPSPVAEAILQGETVTGVTIMQLDEGTDTGPVLAQEEVEIGPDDTAGKLTARLFALGGGLMARTLREWADGRIEAVAQDEARATYSRKLEKADGELDFTRPAADLHNQVRAMDPWPGAYTTFKGATLKVLRTSALPAPSESAPTGTVVTLDGAPAAAVTTDGSLALRELQLEGRRATDAESFLRGRPDLLGAHLPS
ncbi:MAG: methionyl-tRNA formyltransferase [Chloroflexota bacterium]|nr:methionyl-tRNA formyltransferase [Chloroflexota bacterium]MDE2968511.1 methionyl-tRNA formyltransferase [Chloroflexota bacterium]